MPSSKYVIKCPDIVQGIFEHWLQQNKAHMEDWIDAINIVDRYPPELIRDLVNALPFTPLRPKQTFIVPEDLYILTPERLVTDLVFTLLSRTFHHNMVNFMTANPDLKGRALMADIEQRLGDMISKPVEVNGIVAPEETLYSCHFSGVDISDGLHGEYSVLELKLFQQRKHFQELAIWEGTEALFSSVPKFTLDLTYLVDMFGSSVIDIFSQRSGRFSDLSEGSINIENQYASSTSTEGSRSNRGLQQQSNSKKSKGTLQVAHTSQQHTLEADMANLASPFDDISDDQEDMDVSDLDLGEPLPRLTNIPDNYPTIQMKTRKHSPVKRQPRAHRAPIVVPLIEHHDRVDQTKGGKRTIELSSIVKIGGGMDQASPQHSPQIDTKANFAHLLRSPSYPKSSPEFRPARDPMCRSEDVEYSTRGMGQMVVQGEMGEEDGEEGRGEKGSVEEGTVLFTPSGSEDEDEDAGFGVRGLKGW